MLWARILSMVSPFLVSGLTAVLFWQQSKFYYLLSGSLLATLLTLWLLIKISGSVKKLKEVIYYLLKGSLFVLASWLLFIFLENLLFKTALFLLTFVLLFFYYQQLFIQLFKSPFKKEEPSFYFHFLEIIAVFFAAAGLFGLKDFLNYHPLWLIFFIFILTFLFAYLKPAPKNPPGSLLIYSLVTAILLSEIFWAILSLSLVYYLKGILFSFIYLIFIVATPAVRLENKRLLKNYLIVIFIIVLLLLLTARWF